MKQATVPAQDNTSSDTLTYVELVKGTASHVIASVQETASRTASQTKNAAHDFQSQISSQTNAAANEGEKDVEAIKAAGAGYVDQAKSLAGNPFATTQGHASDLDSNSSASEPNAPQLGILSSLQSTANTSLETSKTYLAFAQEAIQPRLQSAQETVQPYLESAQATAQPYVETVINASEKAQSTVASAFRSGNGNERNQSS